MLRTSLLSCFLGLVALSWSQEASSRFEVFGGYTYTPKNFLYSGNAESGWDAGVDMNADRWIGLKADVAQYFSTYPRSDLTSKTTSFLVGPQVSIQLSMTSRIMPFAQFLIGGVHIGFPTSGFETQASSSFAWDFGGGLDFRLSRHFWLRGQGDYLHSNLPIAGDNVLQSQVPRWHARITTGLVFRF